MSEARSKGGIQAYKGHSTYMRGRKIKVLFKDKSAEAEQELSLETGETTGAEVSQVVAVDGEELNYSGSISWECIPGNLEVIVNTKAYFIDSQTFKKGIDKESKEAAQIAAIVDKIWLTYDKDKNGELDREESKVFLQTVLSSAPGYETQEGDFDTVFDSIDANGDGLLDKAEM